MNSTEITEYPKCFCVGGFDAAAGHVGKRPLAETIRHCAGCGEPEGSSYAKHCCYDEDNMIDDGGEEE